MSVQGAGQEKTKLRVKEPSKYQVIMYNDDFTPMDFVVDILVGIFHKQEREAVALMYQVHESGHAVVGIYVMDIAATKVRQATEKARAEGYPFQLGIEGA